MSRRTRPRVNAVSHNTAASNEGSRRFHNHGEGPSLGWAFSWLKALTCAFTTILRHYAKQASKHGQ